MSQLSLHKITKAFDTDTVLEDINVDIEKGEFIVIVGPSGCGKSTLLRIIAGLEQPTWGDIIMDGKVINKRPPKRRDIAMVFQSYALYPHMTVYDNMAYGLRMRQVPKAEIDQKIHWVSEILELTDYLNRTPKELSGGQKQRVAMGRAIVRQPRIFLFDEPLSNLDAKLRVQMRLEIKKLHQKLGVTSVYVTHDQIEAMTLAERIIVMNEGKIEQVATPYEIYNHPSTTFVAGFMGTNSMNFVKAKVTDSGLQLGQKTTIPINNSIVDSINDSHVLVGFRPEKVLTESVPDSFALDIKVELVEPTGADKLIHARVEELGTKVTARIANSKRLTSDMRYRIYIPKDELHLFNIDSLSRINTAWH